jgi:uncharacterized damage-inducible protein DinB
VEVEKFQREGVFSHAGIWTARDLRSRPGGFFARLLRMTLDDAVQLFAYNKWANDRMLGSLQPLTTEQLAQALGMSFPSVSATAAHIAAAEWIWLSRWKGTSPSAMPDWATAPSLPAVTARFAALEDERTVFLRGLSDADLTRPLTYTLLSGASDTQPLVVLFQHVVNHGTYHRGQIAGMLRQLGATPAPTDLIRWARS